MILSPQTIGPFQTWWSKKLAGLMMTAAKKVVTRDKLSSDYLKEMGLGQKLIESTDVAFRLPYRASQTKVRELTRVGLNVSGLLFNGGYNKNNMFSLSADYKDLMRSLCTHFTALPNTELHLVGHVNSERHDVEDDYRICELLASEFPSAIVAPRFVSPSDAKTYIATMDFFAGSRMHACIAAFASGVPVLPIAYSRKFAGLFGTLDYNHLADCKSQRTEEIFAVVIEAFDRREELKVDVKRSTQLAYTKLQSYKELLRKTLGDIVWHT